MLLVLSSRFDNAWTNAHHRFHQNPQSTFLKHKHHLPFKINPNIFQHYKYPDKLSLWTAYTSDQRPRMSEKNHTNGTPVTYHNTTEFPKRRSNIYRIDHDIYLKLCLRCDSTKIKYTISPFQGLTIWWK